MKTIIMSCIHGRHNTVLHCVKNTPKLDRLWVYSDAKDLQFLKQIGFDDIVHAPNNPLSNKWNTGVKALEEIDFDVVIMMGADDYFDQNFLDFVEDKIQDFDMVSFKDMYFEDRNGIYYHWDGYKNHRTGEPAGAGKAYTKEYLERIGYNLFPVRSDKGLDGQSWVVANYTEADILVTSLKDNNLWLCDMKDGQGITPLKSLRNLKRVTRK